MRARLSPAMRVTRFIVTLVASLGALTLVAFLLVGQTVRRWFESDIQLRAHLAVTGSREALLAQWTSDPTATAALQKVLGDIARDDRVTAVAACDLNLTGLAATAAYPDYLSCRFVEAQMRPRENAGPEDWVEWSATEPSGHGALHVMSIPLRGEEPNRATYGFIVLVHDLDYVERRVTTARNFLLAGFVLLALASAILTIVGGRISWRGWSKELRALLRGIPPRPEFAPFVKDVRELVDRLATEREADGLGGLWTPQRLKNTLTRHLQGERVVLLANREPYVHDRTSDGGIRIVHPASGLVTALEPVMRACSGVWVAHGTGSADRDVVDQHSRVRVPPGDESYQIRRLWLSAEEEKGYYYGFSNEGLWPLCHLAHTRPVFRSEDWRHYKGVNRRFADAVCEEVDADDPIVLVQDYHFALAPAMIREKLPRATVLTFWHIPWPSAERFGICPWRDEILAGLLGSSIVGFHTQAHCINFLEAADRFLESRIDRELSAVVHKGQSTLVRPYPISIEWPSENARRQKPVSQCRADVFRELGLPPHALLGVGVDRLDYTKGIEERLGAVEVLLEREPRLRGLFTFVQLAAPSRTLIPEYQRLNERVEEVATRVNARFATGAYRPVILLRSHHEPDTVFRFYRAADVCYVSSLHDGMNLVAKEFVAARDDEQGVLVLSHFTGASREMPEALIVNPYDLEEASRALSAALSMPTDEQRDRMRAMRAFLAEFNVYRWAGRMLVDAARLRQRERLIGRFGRAPAREAHPE